jgi:UDP-N-acetylglucosamine--N-acetylmuramyl-(pentapeptide) pyrophosphoryl-undecaprenol N-acetylglucosamine transferase
MLPKRQNADRNLRILLTGGHAATTGMAIIQELNARVPNANIYWIGSKQAISGSKATTLEHKIYPSMGVKYFEIKAGKLQTKFTRYTIPLALMIPFGFIQAFFTLLKIRPSVILSFGGAASFPVAFWGWVLQIPVIVHEQTVAAGRATLASAKFAEKIALGRTESAKYFPSGKTVVTGNPLTKEILDVKPKTLVGSNKNILVVGGSRGSEFINEEFIKVVPELSKKYEIVHITGERDFDKYKDLEKENYKVFSFIEPSKMADFYKESDVIVSRSGANTVAEILYIKRPSILIPLPRTFMDEQVKNAKYAEQAGIAKVMLEKEVTPSSLTMAISDSFNTWKDKVIKASKYTSPDTGAARKLVELILEYA